VHFFSSIIFVDDKAKSRSNTLCITSGFNEVIRKICRKGSAASCEKKLLTPETEKPPA
jgi:hypothetical protein